MKGKTILCLVWTAVVIAALVLIGFQLTKDWVYTGTKIEFTTGRTIQIDADKVTFQAASPNFFVLRKESGETITGAPAQKPLGWASDQYFVAGPEEVPGGKWLFPVGSASVIITSNNPNPLTVRLIEVFVGLDWGLFSFVAVAIWVLGILFVNS